MIVCFRLKEKRSVHNVHSFFCTRTLDNVQEVYYLYSIHIISILQNYLFYSQRRAYTMYALFLCLDIEVYIKDIQCTRESHSLLAIYESHELAIWLSQCTTIYNVRFVSYLKIMFCKPTIYIDHKPNIIWFYYLYIFL